MNYYEHHLGDYDGATSHLSWDEDLAYRRLICLYYRTEAPIPADVKQACRLVRAASKPQRDAVQQVLAEFFDLRDDGWHNARCDRDIGAFHELEPEREAKRDNAKERQRRARERRAELFEALRGHNIVPPYDTTTRALEALLSRVTGGEPATAPVTPVTRDNTATHTHLPPPTSQVIKTEDKGAQAATPPPHARPIEADPPEANGQPPTAAGSVCRAMRTAGLAAVNPGDPRLLALLDQGATEDELVGIAAEAVGKGKGWAWVLTVVQARRAEAGQIALVPKPDDPLAWRKTADGVFSMAERLGVKAKPDELFHDLERRVLTAFQRAEGRQASAA
ncbi:MAG: hypothetical protein RJA36_293 [Pseudomonadota bacterium]|jgi:uncharacterized protein YdaU (DUF1376 family)